jgi:hypothetical protein
MSSCDVRIVCPRLKCHTRCCLTFKRPEAQWSKVNSKWRYFLFTQNQATIFCVVTDVTSHEMCATTEILEACWHVSRPDLHVRSRDVSRVDRSVSLRQNSMLNIPTALVTSHELMWREDSVSPAVYLYSPTGPSWHILWGNFTFHQHHPSRLVNSALSYAESQKNLIVNGLMFSVTCTPRGPSGVQSDSEVRYTPSDT